MKKTRLFLAAVGCLTLTSIMTIGGAGQSAPTAPPKPAPLQVPAGFKVEVFAAEITGGRLMAVSPDGVLYIARQPKGDVVALPDRNGDGKADSIEVVASGLTRPHSVAFHKGYLYIATNPAILRMKYEGGKAQGTPEKVVDLPVSTTSHWTRTIDFGPDGKMYVSIGSSCNSCEEEDERRTTIMQYNADGSGGRIFARGLRNAIGMDFDPKTGKLWATDMGQDKQGEEFPPCEINLIEDGKHYGFPYFIGDNVPNADLPNPKGSLKKDQAVPPAYALQPHISPIGATFYEGKKFPAAYRTLFVALHGSSPTGRKERIGYKVVRVNIARNKVTSVDDFVTGFLSNGEVFGRPAGMATGADGALYISDDNKGFIYRVTYGK